MNTFQILQEIYDTIEEVKASRDNAFYGHDGNQLYNVDTDNCYFNADNIGDLDTKIDNLYNKYMLLRESK